MTDSRSALPSHMPMLVISAIVLVVGVAAYAIATPLNAPLVVPLAILTCVAAAFFVTLIARQQGTAPVFQIGGFFGLMAFLYAAYPITVFLAKGMVYGPANDTRMFGYRPSPGELATLEWWYFVHFVAFAAVYLAVTQHRTPERFVVLPPPPRLVLVVVGLYFAVSAILLLRPVFYPFPIHTYADTYLAIQRMPRFPRQIVGTLTQLLPTLLIMATAALFMQYRRNRIWIALLLGWICFSTVRAMQARTLMFLILFVAGCLYHNLVRRITLAVAAGGIIAALGGLALMGHMRDERSRGDVNVRGAVGGSSEFEVILANAYDLKYEQHASGDLLRQPIVYFSDFIALIPQQFLPFSKQTKSEWYLATYWPKVTAKGGGYAFGVLSEAVTGWGVAEMLVRGAIVGLFFGLFQRRMAAGPVSFWQLTAYLWLTVWSYQLLRNTTFGILQWSVYQLLFPIIGIRLVYAVCSRFRRPPAVAWRPG